MKKGVDYRIEKIEKSPLQRFKNKNLLTKKFGDNGLKIYNLITGKKTVTDIKENTDMSEKEFYKILDYLEETGMIKLTTGKESEKEQDVEAEEIPTDSSEDNDEKWEPRTADEEKPEESKEQANEDDTPTDEIEPVEITPEGLDFDDDPPKKKKIYEPNEEMDNFEKDTAREDDIIPEKEDDEEVNNENESTDEYQEEVKYPDEEIEKYDASEEESQTSEETPNDDIEPTSEEFDVGETESGDEDELSPVEKIMNETGLSESKLVEILDFMDEQGIIKLDYPKAGTKKTELKEELGTINDTESEEFAPMIATGSELDAALITTGISPIITPIKIKTDIVKNVQIRAKVLLKFSDLGSKILENIDGKQDIIEIALKLKKPLYRIMEIVRFLMANGTIMLKTSTRTEVRQKYGDDGYAVFKMYGKEGVMLYELIGKEMTIKQMADMVMEDRAKIVDMFIFIHQVLGIDLPLDKAVLRKQLGV